MSLTPVGIVGATYTASERGLVADALASRALGLAPVPICTSIVVASGGRVTDVTDVPVDTVLAQLDHVLSGAPVAGWKVGILGGSKTAIAVLDALADTDAPVILDLIASGPSGETTLSARGVDVLADRLHVAHLVTASRADAEFVTGGQIESLDDAQVAAQRIHNRGARAVLIRCGALPYRFYDAADDPGHGDSETSIPQFADLYYDGEDFALFEAPAVDTSPDGASSVFALAALATLVAGGSVLDSLQSAKRFATESVRHALPTEGHGTRINPHWETESATT